jgi:putative transposase
MSGSRFHIRNIEDLLHERGIYISHERVRFWWNRFGPMFATEVRRKLVQQLHAHSNWQWHLDKVFVKINGEQHYLCCAVDHEGEFLETSLQNAAIARPHIFVTDKL